MTHFSEIEMKVLNRIQKDMPMIPDIYRELARELSMPPGEFLYIASDMKERGVLRTVSAIFDARKIGYRSALVAMRVAPGLIEKASSVVNSHPGVSHNYIRDNEYNMWFTIADESDEKMRFSLRRIAELSGTDDYIILENKKQYKIGVILDVSDEPGAAGTSAGPQSNPYPAHDAVRLSEDEIETVRVLQYDLPVIDMPFEALAIEHKSRLSAAALLEIGKDLKHRGLMRRYAGVLRHQKAGYTSNAMTVWRPDGTESLDSAASLMSRERSVSHLYVRTVHEGRWEYPLFAMIHAKSDSELSSIIDGIAHRSGITDYRVLKSVKELKKMRVRYFTGELDSWRRGTPQ